MKDSLADVEAGGISIIQTREIQMKNIVFENCTAVRGNGGALIMQDSSTISMENCLFKGNSALLGGALYMDNC